jgi:preprotein translocase subunit SecE
MPGEVPQARGVPGAYSNSTCVIAEQCRVKGARGAALTKCGNSAKIRGEVEMRKIIQFIQECQSELKKVIWPGRDDVISSVKVVIISTVLIAAVLGFVDFVLLLGVQKIF